jgi:hypothetical protein
MAVATHRRCFSLLDLRLDSVDERLHMQEKSVSATSY